MRKFLFILFFKGLVFFKGRIGIKILARGNTYKKNCGLKFFNLSQIRKINSKNGLNRRDFITGLFMETCGLF